MTHCTNREGIVTYWPKKTKDKQAVLLYLAEKFSANRLYSEKEVNALLNHYHNFGDWALLRRELFEKGFLVRNAAKGLYWKPNPLAQAQIPRTDDTSVSCNKGFSL